MWRSRKQREADLNRELRDHLKLEADEKQALGMSPEDARYAAQRALGNTTSIEEDVRAVWPLRFLDESLRNMNHAWRVFSRRPSFAIVAIASLALGIGANIAVFAFVRAVMLKTLHVAGAERLVVLGQNNERFHIENCCFNFKFYQELRRQDIGFQNTLALTTSEVNLTVGDRTQKLTAELVTGDYFSTLGIRPTLGRLLNNADDDAEGASAVCVISYRLWKDLFGSSSDIVGSRVLLNAHPFQIVGVSEPGFSGAALHESRDLQVPSSMIAKFLGDDRNSMGWAQIMARLKPGVTLTEAQTRLNVAGRRIQAQYGPEMGPRDTFLLHDGTQGFNSKKENFAKPLLILLLLVVVVLMVACANLAAISLVRSFERNREAGVRIALGASRASLIRQFLVESLLLAGLGGLAGWVVSRALIRIFLTFLATDGDNLTVHVQPDLVLVGFSIAVTITVAFFFGILPAWRAAHIDPLPAIRGLAGSAIHRPFASRLLIAGQVALSLALLFGAGLFSQTLRNLRSIDLGFHTQNVALMHIDLSRTAHSQKDAAPFFEELLRRTRELPLTRAASLSDISVVSGRMQSITVNIPGFIAATRVSPTTYFTRVSGGYFRTLGVPLIAGRDFTSNDNSNAENTAIVNQQFAREFFSGNALGKVFTYGGNRKARVIGIARTTHFRWIREDPRPILYLPTTQFHFPESLFLQVQSTGGTSQSIQQLRAIVNSLDARVPIDQVTTLRLQIDQALNRERLLSFLSTLMGTLAVSLAAIGLYGVLSFSVVRRTREIGIRLAVGADRNHIMKMFFRECAWILLFGACAGIPLALAFGKLSASLLYGLKPQDPLTALAATIILTLAAFAAALIPARRAGRVDPVTALRYE